MSYTKQPQQLPDVHGDKVKWFPRLCEATAQDVWEKKKKKKHKKGSETSRALSGDTRILCPRSHTLQQPPPLGC